jgi:RNA polymerase sporulation-specific sigma factor
MKHTPLNNGVSLEDAFDDASNSNVYSALGFRRVPEEQVLARESADELFHTYSQCLSSFEIQILRMYLDGLSYREMAAYCGRNEKSVDNAVQRIRRKLARDPNFGDISRS